MAGRTVLVVPELESEGLVPSSPHVMLSPKATNLVTESFGGTVTVTVKVQLSLRSFASVTLQRTGVVPGVKTDPLAGAQVGPTSGGTPPAASAVP
jgi:hypothetical protein